MSQQPQDMGDVTKAGQGTQSRNPTGEMSSKEDTPEPGTSAANTSQAAPAAPQDSNQENPGCPECQHISTVCTSSCRHCFCQLCTWDWSLGEAVCPRCQRPTRHPYPQHVALYHEVQDRVYNSKQRWSSHYAQQPWSLYGHFRRGRPWERRRRRSMRWPRNGRRQSRHTRGSDSSRWWQQQRRAWEEALEEGQIRRFEWAIPASSQGNQSWGRSSRSWSQHEQPWGHRRWSRDRERSHGWDRRQSRSSPRDQDAQTGSHDRSTRQRRWRSWNADDRHAPRPQHDVPTDISPETRGEREDSDSSRQRRTRRRRTRGRSHRRGQNSQGTMPRNHSANQRRWRSWDDDDRHTPRSQSDTPSRRSERHQWEDWDSPRQQHATRRRTRGRSHRRGQSSQRASQGMVPRDHSTNQRRWRSWNADQGQAPASQQDIPGSSGRSWHQCRDT
ncbi:G patch domain-containing protein 8-like isoform X2 [Cyanistes caeruleus]|uniref:G patch domain-containing protein 8-like isoform X2 n=1 Tax=Cyanistes caeruleus TaxID=156563 RepID=UPI000CDA4CD1|nr:G patch domain-containing protein 8-like isoform X2 [Cyanistes caeruleus]